MNNLIVISHEGGMLNDDKELKLVKLLTNITSRDSETIRISQLTRDEAIQVIAGFVVNKTAHEEVPEKNSEQVKKAIQFLQSLISLGGVFPQPRIFGSDIAGRLVNAISSNGKMEAALKNAVSILATEEVDLDSTLCKNVGLTKLHLLEIQKAHKYFTHFML